MQRKYLYFFLALILACLCRSIQASEQAKNIANEEQSDRTLLFTDITRENFFKLPKSHQHVVMLISSGKKKEKSLLRTLGKLQNEFQKDKIAFANLKYSQLENEDFEKYKIPFKPTFYFFINGAFKQYHGDNRIRYLRQWIQETLDATIHTVSSPNDIHYLDTHFYVYASEKAVNENRKKLMTLAKLISPLRIYTGWDSKHLKIKAGTALHLPYVWMHQDDQSEVIKVEMHLPVQELVYFIHKHKLPRAINCKEGVIKYLTDLSVPLLVYFSDKAEGMHDDRWEIISKVAKDPKINSAVAVRVNLGVRDRCSHFFRSFLGVQTVPSLRFIHIKSNHKAYRTAFNDQYTLGLVKIFLATSLRGIQKHYHVNQKLERRTVIDGIRVANRALLRKALADSEHSTLIYIHNGLTRTYRHDLRIMRELEERLVFRTEFRVMAIDHDQNDLDGRYHRHLPQVMLLSKKGKIESYNGKIDVEHLLSFIEQNVHQMDEVPAEEVQSDL